MARIACSTWDGGGNVIVFRALVEQLRARGHDVELQVGWERPPLLDGDLLLVDHMTTVAGLDAALASARRVATVVHTMWSFVPSLEGGFAAPGYLDRLSQVAENIVFTIPELDRVDLPGNAVHVGPVFEDVDERVAWPVDDEPRLVVGLGTTDMGETDALQRVLDALATMPVRALVTVGPHIEPSGLRAAENTVVTGFVDHRSALVDADLFVGHGGHGGIMAALSRGVPVLSLPFGRDQPHNAERVASCGAGRTLDPTSASIEIATAIASMIGDRELRRAAEHLAASIERRRGDPITVIERLLV